MDSGSEGSGGHDYLEEAINQETQGEIRHEPIPTPDNNCPFDNEELILFTQPPGYGLHPEEWGDLGYPAFGTIRAGRRGRKELQIALPDYIWRPRAERWGTALYLMNQIMFSQE